MKEETLVSIYKTIEKYLNQKKIHPNYIDHYELYGINPNIKASELKSYIRPIRKLFHPDQKKYISQEYHSIYDEIINSNTKFFAIENNEEEKEKYDRELNRMHRNNENNEKKEKEEGPQHFYDGQENPFARYREEEKAKPKRENPFAANSSNQENNSNGFREDYTYTQSEEFKKNLNSIKSAVETMIFKYGFEGAYNSIIELLNGNFNAITRDNNMRKRMADIGLNNLRKTVQYANLNGNPVDNTMDIFVDVMTRTGIRERSEDFYSSCDEIERQKGNGSVGLYDLLHEKVYNNDPTADYFLDRKKSHTTNQDREFSPNDIKFLMYAKVHKNRNGDENLAFSKLGKNPKGVDYLIENYCDIVSLENKKYYQGY